MTARVWSEQRGDATPRVTVYERADKDFTVWLRWWEGGKARLEITVVRKIRDGRSRILKHLQERAQREADEKWNELHGKLPTVKSGPVTFPQGIALAFSKRGPYYTEDPHGDRHTRRCKRYLEELGRILGHPHWPEITPGMVKSVWRTLRARYDQGGYRKAEQMISTMYVVAGFLAEEFPTQAFPRPIRHWRQELKEHWRKTDRPIKPLRPRHSPDETAKVLGARGKGDPRAELALVIGAELRGGQVVQAMRSHVNLGAGIKCRHGYLGELRIPYRSVRKRIPPIWFNWRERLAFERATRRGYLADCERAYQAGEIKDYALFPAGKLRRGKAVPGRSQTHAWPETMISWVHDLERAAGVKPQRGRAWHGLRRGLSDVEETATPDERVKDQLGGWAPGSDMRRGTYQQEEDPAVLEGAAQVRATARPRATKPESGGES